MKALSIKQPWASLIALGIKPIENRTRKTKLRGKILIHASAATVFDAIMPQNSEFITVAHWLEDHGYDWHYNNIPHSAIIGEVDIVDCVQNHSSVWAEKFIETDRCPECGDKEFLNENLVAKGYRMCRSCHQDWYVDVNYGKPIYNWVLANPVLYAEPILNVKGKLSFWDYELPDHFHLPVKGGHATFSSPPTKETMDAVKKMADLAWNIHTKKY